MEQHALKPPAPTVGVWPEPSPPGLSVLAFAAFSVSSGLFFFGCLKLLNFHWFPMNVLLSLLLVGMPIGGFLALRFLRPELPALSRSLVLQVGGMLVALGLLPLFFDPASRIDRVLLGELGVSGITFMVIKFLQLGLVFAPYFITFGMNEFLGYRIVLPVVGRRSELAYALFLGGTSLAYVIVEFGSPWLGVVPLMLTGAGLAALVAALLRQRDVGGRMLGAAALVLLVGAWMPGLEDRYLTMLELEGPMQVRTMRQKPGVEILHRRWGRYCHFSVASLSPSAIAGFYNGGLHWFHRTERTRKQIERDTLEAVPFAQLRPGAKVLIIGSGGAEQVRTALMFEPARVVAVEIIPEVLQVLGGPIAPRIGNVYGDPRVEPVAMDGRRYLEGTDERFDLIFLPVVDTSITMMRSVFNPAETLYTVEAFDTMRRHLTDDGVLVIQRPAFFDQHGVLLHQYFRALRDLGMSPYVWLNNPKAVAGQAGPGLADTSFPLDTVYLLFARRQAGAGELPPATEDHLRAKGYFRADDFGALPYLPKTDNFLFRSDLLFSMFGQSPLNRDLVIPLAATFALVLGIVALLRRFFGDASGPGGVPFWVLLGLGILVGLNFLLLQQFFIFKLMRILPRPIDAMFSGTVGFLLLTAACGLSLTRREGWFVAVLVVAFVAAGALGLGLVTPATGRGVLVALPLAALTGALFPSVFRGSDRALLVVFAADALGALVGGLAAFLWPIALGFQSYDRLTLTVLVLTALAVLSARRRWNLVAG